MTRRRLARRPGQEAAIEAAERRRDRFWMNAIADAAGDLANPLRGHAALDEPGAVDFIELCRRLGIIGPRALSLATPASALEAARLARALDDSATAARGDAAGLGHQLGR